jgi:MFS family permease
MQNGYMYAIVGLTSAMVQTGLLRIISKVLSEIKLIAVGSFFMIAGLGLMPYGGNFAGLVVIVLLLSFGTGILQPTLLSMISESAPEAEQGITLGLNQSFSAFGRVLGPLWGGFAFEYMGYQFPFLTGAAFTSIILIAALFYLPGILGKHENTLNIQ